MDIVNNKKIIALTACPVGIAHTYIAQQKLEDAATKLGYEIKVETHGSIGTKNILTSSEIEEADIVILALAAGGGDLKLERFENKKVYKVEIKEVVKNSEEVINTAFEKAMPYIHTKSGSSSDDKNKDMFSMANSQGLMKHIMAGVGYMVPFVVFGGIMLAISIGIAKAVYGVNADPGSMAPSFLFFMNKAGVAGFTLMIPALAGYIAFSIAGRAALAPAMISAFIANGGYDMIVGGNIKTFTLVYPIAGLGNETPAGFLGALLIGPAVGYLVRWITTWQVPKVIAPVMPIFVIPIGVTFVVSFIFIYAIGAPIGWVMSQFKNGLMAMPKEAMAAIGILIGAMAGFDMGGPINKVAFLAASTSITADPHSQLLMGAMAAAIPVAPIGMGLTTMIFRKSFNEAERGLGITALLMGCIGISEGAIPFAVRDLKRAVISNVIGSAVAGGIAGTFLVTDAAAHGGPIVAFFLAISSVNYGQGLGIVFFFLAIIIGSCVTMGVYGWLLTLQRKNINIFSSIKKSLFKSKTETNVENVEMKIVNATVI